MDQRGPISLYTFPTYFQLTIFIFPTLSNIIEWVDPFITPMSAQDSEENGGFAELQFSTTLSPSLASKVTQNLVQL